MQYGHCILVVLITGILNIKSKYVTSLGWLCPKPASFETFGRMYVLPGVMKTGLAKMSTGVISV